MQKIIWIIIIVLVILLRLFFKFKNRIHPGANKNLKPLKKWQKKIFTVLVFSKLSTKRFFRDRLALFFGVLFPLIFLFVFGGIFGKAGDNVNFKVAVINHSSSQYATEFINQEQANKIITIDSTINTLSAAEAKMDRNQLDATVVLPTNFGLQVKGQTYPSGNVIVYYTENNAQAGQALVSILQTEFQNINTKFIKIPSPFTASGQELNQKSLSEFDYTFSGLLGFSIIGLGIFGPINVFPELKKQGILRRLHTTPIRVWQYFMSTMISQAIIGLISIAIMFVTAIAVFHLKVVGNYFEIILFLILSIIMILGIGLAIGGWGKNERQVAPLANIIVFPMLFLSGTFFPRYDMPIWLQHITNYLPLTPVIDGIRLLATEGVSITQIGTQLVLVLAWTVIIYIIAFRVFRWE
jgi:ABC-2 type transport system permease protein